MIEGKQRLVTGRRLSRVQRALSVRTTWGWWRPTNSSTTRCPGWVVHPEESTGTEHHTVIKEALVMLFSLHDYCPRLPEWQWVIARSVANRPCKKNTPSKRKSFNPEKVQQYISSGNMSVLWQNTNFFFLFAFSRNFTWPWYNSCRRKGKNLKMRWSSTKKQLRFGCQF